MTKAQARSLRRELERSNGILAKQVGDLTAKEVGLLVRLALSFTKEDDHGYRVKFRTLSEIPRLLAQNGS